MLFVEIRSSFERVIPLRLDGGHSQQCMKRKEWSQSVGLSGSLFIALLAGTLILAPKNARAESQIVCKSETASIEKSLSDGRERTRLWANFWGTTWAVATAGQAAAAAITSDHGLKEDLWVGSAGSALGLIPTWIDSPRILSNPPLSQTEPCARLAEAQAELNLDAQSDDEVTGFAAQVANVGVNLVIGAVLVQGFGHTASALISIGIGIPLGEAMILTHPRSAALLRESRMQPPQVAFALVPGGGQLITSFRF